MAHTSQKNSHALHHPPAQESPSWEDGRPDVAQHLICPPDGLADALVCLDRQWRVTYLNPQAEYLLQKPRKELLGKMLWEAFPGAVGSALSHQSHPAGETPLPFRFEAACPLLNKWLEVYTSLSNDGMAVFFRDITQHKRVEAELFTLAAIVESAEDAIYSKTLAELMLSWNKGAERLYGYSAQEMIGNQSTLLCHPTEGRN